MRHRPGQLYWKAEGGGMVGEGSWGILPEGAEADDWTCVSCQHPDCTEWPDFWSLPGTTREEAAEALKLGLGLGNACHVTDCQLLDAPPPGWTGRPLNNGKLDPRLRFEHVVSFERLA